MCLLVLSRTAAAAMEPWRRRRILQTWTSWMQRRGAAAASGGPERIPPTLLSFPATSHLLPPTHRHKQPGNKPLKPLRMAPPASRPAPAAPHAPRLRHLSDGGLGENAALLIVLLHSRGPAGPGGAPQTRRTVDVSHRGATGGRGAGWGAVSSHNRLPLLLLSCG